MSRLDIVVNGDAIPPIHEDWEAIELYGWTVHTIEVGATGDTTLRLTGKGDLFIGLMNWGIYLCDEEAYMESLSRDARLLNAEWKQLYPAAPETEEEAV